MGWIAFSSPSGLFIARPDGSTTLDVRIVLQTDDGATIGMTYRGLRHGRRARPQPGARDPGVHAIGHGQIPLPVFEAEMPNWVKPKG